MRILLILSLIMLLTNVHSKNHEEITYELQLVPVLKENNKIKLEWRKFESKVSKNYESHIFVEPNSNIENQVFFNLENLFEAMRSKASAVCTLEKLLPDTITISILNISGTWKTEILCSSK